MLPGGVAFTYAQVKLGEACSAESNRGEVERQVAISECGRVLVRVLKR